MLRRVDFTSHSGLPLWYKIECDDLSDAEVGIVAQIIAGWGPFSQAVGVPRGGLRLADALAPYAATGPALIVDDVLTTGQSMEKFREMLPDARGAVIFARQRCPSWVRAVFQMVE